MGYDVFISHSSKDKKVADAVCATLEANGIRCWIAPRDIVPGRTWANSILQGISECRAMVLVFSSAANGSKHVCREVERAVFHGIPVAPVRIQDVMPTGDLEYFLSSPHWMDALTPPFTKHLRQLAMQVRTLLEIEGRPVGPAPALTPVAPAAPPVARATPSRPHRQVAVAVLLSALLLLAGAAGWAWHAGFLQRQAVRVAVNDPPGRPDALSATAPLPPPETSKGYDKEFTNTLGMKLLRIAAGEFDMGSPKTEEGHNDDETPHHVKLTKAFYMAATPVTQRQWKGLAGENPSSSKGTTCRWSRFPGTMRCRSARS